MRPHERLGVLTKRLAPSKSWFSFNRTISSFRVLRITQGTHTLRSFLNLRCRLLCSDIWCRFRLKPPVQYAVDHGADDACQGAAPNPAHNGGFPGRPQAEQAGRPMCFSLCRDDGHRCSSRRCLLQYRGFSSGAGASNQPVYVAIQPMPIKCRTLLPFCIGAYVHRSIGISFFHC